MKHISMIARIVGLLAGGAVPLAFGLTSPQAYIDSYRGRTDIPVPVKVVAPSVNPSLVGAQVQVEFVVDAAGRPRDVRVLSATDADFGLLVRETVKQWRFAPARANGSPVPMKVDLPIVVVGP